MNTTEPAEIDLQEIFFQRVERVKRISEACPDGTRFTLVIIINRWSIRDYFEVLDSLLQTTSDSVLNGWMANFTKVLVYSGNPLSSYVAPYLSIVSHSSQCAALLIKEDDKMPHFLRLLKPLKTSAVVDNFQHQHAPDAELKSNKEQSTHSEHTDIQPSYLLEIYNDSLRLEQLIVDCTHSYCEFILIEKFRPPLQMKLSLSSELAELKHSRGAYFRVIANQSRTELALRAVLSSA